MSTFNRCSPFACLLTFWLSACSGRAVNLDGIGEKPSPGPASNVVELHLSSPAVDFWVDGERIYWTDYDTLVLKSCAYDDCSHTLATYASSAGPLAWSEHDVFFAGFAEMPGGRTRGSRLLRCSKLGCVGEPALFLQDAARFPTPPIVDADFLYWSSSFDIYRCALSACTDPPELVAQGYTSNGALAVFGPNVYWWAIAAASPDWPTAQTETHLYAAPRDGSAPPTELTPSGPIATAEGEPIAVDAGGLYWIDAGTRIVTCPLAGCAGKPPMVAVDTPTSKRSLQVDELGLYWIDPYVVAADEYPTTGVVRFCPLPGCASGEEPAMLTAENARKFQLDAHYLYWNADLTATAGGTFNPVVYRAPKPTPGPQL